MTDNKSHREGWKAASTSDRIVATSTLAMAVFTVILTVLAALQWHEIHTGSADTHDLALAAKTQAANTITLANAAKKQADEAEQQVEKLQSQIEGQSKILQEATAQAQATNELVEENKRAANSANDEVDIARGAQRPWMIFNVVADEPTLGNKFKVSAVAQNSGKSPAYIVASLVTVSYDSNSPDLFTNFPPGGFKGVVAAGSQTVITPGNVYTSESEIEDKLTTTQSQLESTGLYKWYIYAYLTYKDLATSKVFKSRSCNYWDTDKKHWLSCNGFDSAD